MNHYQALIDKNKYFGLTNDVLFKIVFSSPGNERLLVVLLNALLQLKGDEQVKELTILNPFNLPEFADGKQSVIDVKAKDRADNKFCIEIQLRYHKDLMKRIIYYSAVGYANQLARGKDYTELHKTVCLWIMGEPLLKEPEIYNKYLISHVDTHKPLTDLIEYHFVELSKFNQDKPEKLRSRFEKWLHILKFGELYRSVDDLPEALKQEAEIVEVVKKMTHANTDERYRDIMFGREMFILDMNTEKRIAREEGREEGVKNGAEKANERTALKMLAKNYAPEDISELTGLSIERIKQLA